MSTGPLEKMKFCKNPITRIKDYQLCWYVDGPCLLNVLGNDARRGTTLTRKFAKFLAKYLLTGIDDRNIAGIRKKLLAMFMMQGEGVPKYI